MSIELTNRVRELERKVALLEETIAQMSSQQFVDRIDMLKRLEAGAPLVKRGRGRQRKIEAIPPPSG